MPVDLNDTYEALYRRAISHMAFGETTEACEALWRIVRRLVRIRPETLQRREALQRMLETSWASLVQFLDWEKRYDEAISACEMVRAHISDGRAERRIGTLRIALGEVEDGLAQMREAVDAVPGVAAWIDLSTAYMELARYEEAERCGQSALHAVQSDEEAVLANLALFRLYQQTDRVSDALDAWGMAIVIAPEIGDGVLGVYSWLIERGDLDQAEQYLRREPDALRRSFYRGVMHWAAGRESDAQAQWRRALSMDPRAEGADVAAWVEAALRVDEPQRALEVEDAISRGGPGLATSLAVMMALAHSALGQDDEAEDWRTEIVRHLDRGWPSLEPVDERRMRVLRSLTTQPAMLEVLERISERN